MERRGGKKQLFLLNILDKHYMYHIFIQSSLDLENLIPSERLSQSEKAHIPPMISLIRGI